MFYIYFLYSNSSDVYYVGHSNDVYRRLLEHNESEHTTYTSKHRPWELEYFFSVNGNRSDAIKIEKFIKKQKSKKLIVKIIGRGLVFEDFRHILIK